MPLVLVAAALLAGGGCEERPAAPAATGGGSAATGAAPAPAPSPPASTPAATARSSAADNPAGWPPIEFEPPELDLGVLAPGEIGRGTVNIWNVGSAPLTIRASRTSCGCTTTDRLDGKTIPPGGSIPFNVAMEPKSGLGGKREGLRIVFAGASAVVSYAFRAEVSLPVRAVPPHITAVDPETNERILSGTVELTARDGRPFRVLTSNGGPPDLPGFDAAADAPRSAYTLRWDLADMDARSAVPWFWVVETDHPDAPIVDVRIRHPSTLPPRPPGRPWVPKDQRVVIGAVQAGQPVEIKAKLEYQPREAPQPQTAAVRSESDLFDIELLDATVDGQVVTVRAIVTPRPGPSGLLYGKAAIEMSGFEMPLRVIGRLE